MKKILTIILLAGSALAGLAQTPLQSPASFLGYELGDRFTPHHQIVAYFRHVDQAMGNVQVIQYGETYEHRPLIYAVIASDENFSKLEEIRKNNLRRAGMLAGVPSDSKIAIVWLSYGVHGNESSSSEAAMKTLFTLADPMQKKSADWLRNTVIILDPCINPDGRDRYVQFYSQFGGHPNNTDQQSAEHYEPWPGGRTNHYLFDLNRDWAWETQVESQVRLKLYNQWLPQVHVDFHEQSPLNPYYFAPAAEPIHREITPWQKEFQEIVGKNNAHYFDQQGWLYFTKERFDLFYPGYGDSYPLFNGAIGMTYEKGGGGLAGLKIVTLHGDTVSLHDRLMHHYTTGISTIEASSKNAERLVDEFRRYFSDPAPRNSAYKAYVVRAVNSPDKTDRFTKWMQTHGIQTGHTAARPARGFDFGSGTSGIFNLSAQDLVISTDQPKGRLVAALFDPHPYLADSITYDITAWNPFYAWSLAGYAISEKLTLSFATPTVAGSTTEILASPYAYIFKYKTIEDVELLSALLQKSIKVRTSRKEFAMQGHRFDPGTLIITRRGNESVANFDALIRSEATRLSRTIYSTQTGLADQGPDFGSGDIEYIENPKVALVSGAQTFAGSCGEVWHYFEQQIHFPVSLINTEQFKSADWWKYTVIVIPEGSYNLFDDNILEQLSRWIADGGRLVVIGDALNAFVDKKGFGLKVYATDQKKKESEEAEKAEKLTEGIQRYGDSERRYMSTSITGAIYRVSLDNSHPLSFGLGEEYYTLKTNNLHFQFLENGWNVGTLTGNVKPVAGFAGYKINKKLSHTLAFGSEVKGRGRVVYLVDNPLFREFWENGKMLFSNVVFLSGL